MKYINFKRYKFSTVVKNFNAFVYNFSKIFKSIEFRRYDFRKIFKYLNTNKFDPRKIGKYLNPKTYDFSFIKKINFLSSKFFLLHVPAFVTFFTLLYLIIPTFFNYNKSDIENAICKNKNIKCSIKGKINYRFYPTPRIKIKDITVSNFFEKQNTIIKSKDVQIKLSFKNLLAKEKHKFKKIYLNESEIFIDLKDLKKFKRIFSKKVNFLPIIFSKSRIIFFDGKNYVMTVEDVNLNLILENLSKEFKLEGKFLEENIYVTLDNKIKDGELLTDILLKVPNLNLLTKANLFSSEKDKNILNGNILINKDKLRFTGLVDYKNNELTIGKSNLRNIFLDGKLEGKITILPYFNFNLDLNLNSINFTRLYNYFLALDQKSQKNLFKVNRKINGNLNFSSNKVYSSYNLVKSFESRIKFNNGNIFFEQFLINLGKLGAADISGSINNDKKFTNFRYESNIFVDNQKKFLSKFGIFGKDKFPSSFYVSGNFDLDNAKATFYEISDDEKLSNEDINFIEKEFNYYMLENNFDNLFLFPKFKDFVKSVTNEVN